ncbi:NUSAP-like protein [Mya arenaria]|uniref:NUSAP-like protein n=1 Tax=Mya arenaria TaxID=6604 RepID=A0ABY7FB04_MYAAR|nr:nucleolar and spindle-associated protein 1-like [Mya arenaria]WAR19348.1 NUSAP-like protein [Mya arenaria]
MQDFASMKYADLRKLAKAAGIKANMKQDKLVAELNKYYKEKEKKEKTSDPKRTPVTNAPAKPKSPAAARSKPSTASSKNSTPSSKLSKPVTPASKPLTPKPQATVTAKATIAKLSTPTSAIAKKDASKPNTLLVKPAKAAPAVVKPSTPASGSRNASRWEKKVFTPSSGTATPTNKSATPTAKAALGKRKKSDTPSESQPATKKRRSTFEKAPTPGVKTPDINSPKSRQSRGSSSGNSPGVKDIVGVMKGDMTDQEMKDSLMSAIDKKVHDKVKAAPDGTSIPRFAAFAMKKKENRPITPGNKDWQKIHKKSFAKFDSIDVYLNKKRKRAEELSASVKKAKTLLTEVHSVVNRLKAHKTPLSQENKFSKSRKSNPNKTTPFKPTVINTSQMNLNFGAKKSPKTLPRQPPKSVISTKVKSVVINAPVRKSTGSVAPRKSAATPFKFTAGNTTLNSTISSTKKNTFDLKASLARPVTWKTHKGVLKPLDDVTKSPVYVRTAVKVQKERANARKAVTTRRADKKDKARMARRGINV